MGEMGRIMRLLKERGVQIELDSILSIHAEGVGEVASFGYDGRIDVIPLPGESVNESLNRLLHFDLYARAEALLEELKNVRERGLQTFPLADQQIWIQKLCNYMEWEVKLLRDIAARMEKLEESKT